ncbi:RagB/SusD family nutrient uptake outer membrane protein [Pedobacter sp. MR2016-19]|uniref:RagB/SusD family nutrient uptake outer membrane protein n=1 Tax=Pedobacter sp. MR2016-19 TaxID=2780089 RepID=UPI001875AD80|nr:RagB/SusD family nutrient uptake outer membrane protein [Pedobacter sp. MR2016-19]MBE5319496.1 RagB/SusD family nutrient uptake outer membrane protein [Pedobacter sp. MR2016-19]
MKNLIYRIAFLLMLTVVSTSCKKILEVKPEFIRTTEQVYANDKSADSVVVGMYAQWASNSNLFDIPVAGGLSSDELKPAASLDDDFLNMYHNRLDPVNSSTKTYWSDYYSVIYTANSIIEGVATSKGMTTSGKQKAIGEALFMRAFCYFYLVNFFGDVPLVTSTAYKETKNFPRTPVAKVYAQILEDLLKAESYLGDQYPTAGRVRANKWVVKALLSRVYLYTGDWKNASLKASEIIENDSQYSLGVMEGTSADDAEMDIFHSDNKESIFQMWNEIGYGLAGQTLGDGAYVAVADEGSNSLIDAFEDGDKRRWNYINEETGGYRIYKYRLDLENSEYKEYTVVFRLAEQYLIRAEALAKLGQLDAAVQDVNTIRNRAGLENLDDGQTESSILDAVEQERRVELCFEWSDRWFNLRRLGHLDQVMSENKPTYWKSTAALYPVPRAEIRNNPKLTQNPGYN